MLSCGVVVAVTMSSPLLVVGPVKVAPLANVAVPETFKFVNDPLEAVVAPMGVLSMAPPVIVAPEEAKVLAVVAPLKVVVPVTASVLCRVVAPVTPSVPPKLVTPVSTVNGFTPVAST